jgi:L,D-transpeptidase ErfK/SrfK
MRILGATLLLFFVVQDLYASGAFPIEGPGSTLIGRTLRYTIKDKETLIELARRFDIGYNEIVSANRGVDPWVPEKGTDVVIPTSWIIPEVMDEGILINLAEMRLYLFLRVGHKRYVRTFPIGIGREGFETPEGTYRIVAMIRDPVWHVPEGIRRERPELPPYIPPGPENPLGRYWLQLSLRGYGIHGTNRPFGIGRMVSHGCIRLYPEDIETLVHYVRIGTMVRIINKPLKVTRHNNRVYIEIETPSSGPILQQRIIEELKRHRLLRYVNKERLMDAVQNPTGLPTVISN